ncbi:MAG TPA: hypothetical protein VFA18_25070, partial [Gemmataceae bacterium]|nr:hypothetical protein [Gemmataceae bacterium]
MAATLDKLSSAGREAAPMAVEAYRPDKGRGLRRRKVLRAVMACLIVVFAGEATARLDDQLRLGVPFWATPDHDRDLLIRTPDGIRGRPNGRFKKWRLNQFGFRGPDMQPLPAPGSCRIMVLGASEMFGLYESPDKEVAHQLAERLAPHGRYEVVNASIAGLTAGSMIPYWNTYLAQFRPQLVVIYASPLFYLASHPAGVPTAGPGHSRPPRPIATPTETDSLLAHSRLLLRLKDQVHVPDFIQGWRNRREVATLTAGKGPAWVFHDLPTDRLAAYVQHMRELATAIRASGAT